MSISIIDPVFTTPYVGPCIIMLYKSNGTPIEAIDGPEEGEPVLKINGVNITIKMSEGCKAVKTNGVMPEGYYIKIESDWSVGFLDPGFGNGIMSKSQWHAPKKQALQELKPAKSIILAELGCPSVFLTQVSTEELKTLQTCR
ncbi:hypothetical protein PoMZ_05406 [Pyricularia oryzae]|uniref:Uncharacterized protein n=1 Tax=Pyricularia oryzae TaxID=318829 RepID=A0A4P7NNH3_PYROR|nr:hypothetical protein PoMZ_05406 [Pyricularia oryzae]